MTHFFGAIFVCCAVLFTNIQTYPQYRNQQKQSFINYSEEQSDDSHRYGEYPDLYHDQNFHSVQMTGDEFQKVIQNGHPYSTKVVQTVQNPTHYRYVSHTNDGSNIEDIQEKLKQLLKKDLEEQVRKLRLQNTDMNFSPVHVNMHEYGTDVQTHSTRVYPSNTIVRSIEQPVVHIQQQQRIVQQENKKNLKPVANPSETTKVINECNYCCGEKQNATCSSCCSTDFIPLLTASALKSLAG